MLIPTSAPTGRNGPSNGECGRPAGPRETCRPIRRLLTGNCGQHLLENQSPLPSGALAGAPKMVSQGTSRRLEQSCYYYPQKMSAPRRSQRERARFFSSVRIHPPGAPPRPGDSWGQPHRLIAWWGQGAWRGQLVFSSGCGGKAACPSPPLPGTANNRLPEGGDMSAPR